MNISAHCPEPDSQTTFPEITQLNYIMKVLKQVKASLICHGIQDPHISNVECNCFAYMFSPTYHLFVLIMDEYIILLTWNKKGNFQTTLSNHVYRRSLKSMKLKSNLNPFLIAHRVCLPTTRQKRKN